MMTCNLFLIYTLSIIVGFCDGKSGSNISSRYDLQNIREFSEPVVLQSKYKLSVTGAGCDCTQDNCGCCVHMESETLHLDNTGCVNITYLPDQYGFSLTFSWDGKIILNETISAKNPPPICMKVPYVDQVELCIDFYNLDVHSNIFSGCVKIEARLLSFFSEDWELGCFKLPAKPKFGKDYNIQKLLWVELKRQHLLKQLKLNKL